MRFSVVRAVVFRDGRVQIVGVDEEKDEGESELGGGIPMRSLVGAGVGRLVLKDTQPALMNPVDPLGSCAPL